MKTPEERDRRIQERVDLKTLTEPGVNTSSPISDRSVWKMLPWQRIVMKVGPQTIR